ncbi:uncharacterized protein [Cicer arietinum]|uniref:uncharacterized protein isoform X2 n=1 Tax=Cicer arietinum TaxID=3827 RepID=UPI003CC65027
MGICNWFQHKFTDPLLLVLRGGADPKLLSFSAALGITFGVFPICGVTVFLCGIAIPLLGSFVNAPILLLANFIATPIELSLIISFLRLGEVICGAPHFLLTSDALKKVLTGHASSELLLSIAHAVVIRVGRRFTFNIGNSLRGTTTVHQLSNSQTQQSSFESKDAAPTIL